MNRARTISKYGALLFLLNGICYLMGEFIAALGTGFPLSEVYTKHFISSLGVYPNLKVQDVPDGFSKLAWVMNTDFIVTGVVFLLAYVILFHPTIKQSKTRYLLLITPILFAIGSVLVGLFQGGVPSEDGLHGIGARLSFIGGNFTLIFTGILLFKESKKYALVSILLGVLGLVGAGLMSNALTNNLKDVVAIFERMTVYPITIWQLMTGMVFLKKWG